MRKNVALRFSVVFLAPCVLLAMAVHMLTSTAHLLTETTPDRGDATTHVVQDQEAKANDAIVINDEDDADQKAKFAAPIATPATVVPWNARSLDVYLARPRPFGFLLPGDVNDAAGPATK